MGVRYSYDDFTTKGHGVIEGPGRVHDESKDALYTFNKKVPKGFEKENTIADISEITKRYAYVSKQTKNQINKELKNKYVLQFRPGEFVKMNDAGKIEIFKQNKVSKNTKNKRTGSNKEKVDSTYEHLLRIHNKANGK
jgi:hypothetical protein